MDKYIVEIDRKNIFLDADGKNKLALSVKADNGYAVFCTEIPLTPYTEPDTEQVRKEAYQKGLNDAWEAARKIAKLNTDEQKRLFGCFGIYFVAHEFSAHEAIEKIRQYEQKKEEIKVGDEIKCDNERYVVLQKYLNDIDEPMAVLFNIKDGKTSVFHLYNGNGAIFEKTGRHFSELVEILKKMREE